MDKKTLLAYAKRIKKAQRSFGVMGDMLLQYDIDAMGIVHAAQLRDALLEMGVEYNYLTAKVRGSM